LEDGHRIEGEQGHADDGQLEGKRFRREKDLNHHDQVAENLKAVEQSSTR
jgi:hypothetical protein